MQENTKSKISAGQRKSGRGGGGRLGKAWPKANQKTKKKKENKQKQNKAGQKKNCNNCAKLPT